MADKLINKDSYALVDGEGKLTEARLNTTSAFVKNAALVQGMENATCLYVFGRICVATLVMQLKASQTFQAGRNYELCQFTSEAEALIPDGKSSGIGQINGIPVQLTAVKNVPNWSDNGIYMKPYSNITIPSAPTYLEQALDTAQLLLIPSSV